MHILDFELKSKKNVEQRKQKLNLVLYNVKAN